MERALGTQYFLCISRPYGTFGWRKATLSTDIMSLKGQATTEFAPYQSAIQRKITGTSSYPVNRRNRQLDHGNQQLENNYFAIIGMLPTFAVNFNVKQRIMRTTIFKKTTVFVAVVLFCTAFSVVYQWLRTRNPFQPSTIQLGVICLLMIPIGLSMGRLVFQKVFNRPVNEFRKIVLPAFILFLLGLLFISLLIISLVSYVSYLIMGLDTGNLLNHLWQAEFPSAIKFYSITIFIVSAYFFYTTWRQAIDREQRLREENLKYKYQTLKTQVNPHFLFNSLNTLSELVYEDSKKADQYIQKLATVYRYILDHEEDDLISLEEELAFVKQFFQLQQERTGNKALLDMDIQNADKYRIIPVSLQLLVENALKHNSMSEDCPLKIHIGNENGYVTVSNGLQKKNIIDHSRGTGLANLKERVKLITGKDVIIHQENNTFAVSLPVIESLK